MLAPTLWKAVICGTLFVIGLLPPHVTLRLIVVETLGGPLRSMLRNRPGLFFPDKPYYNQRGGIAVMTAWSLLLYLLWSAAQGLGPK